MGKALCGFHNDYSLPLFRRVTKTAFSELSWENKFRLLRIKPTNVCRFPQDCSSTGVSPCHAGSHSASSNSSALLFKCSYQFTEPVVSAPGKQVVAISLLSPVSLDFGVMIWQSHPTMESDYFVHICCFTISNKLSFSSRLYFL